MLKIAKARTEFLVVSFLQDMQRTLLFAEDIIELIKFFQSDEGKH